jgi:putative tricarboxylic transport membrane protein
MGISSIVEGFRLITMKRVQVYDVLGPGKYNLGLGVVLIILGLLYLISHRRKRFVEEKAVDKGSRKKMINMIVVLALYSLLINVTGYLLASLVFFVLMFRIVGFKSWLFTGGLSIGISISYYIIFVRWLSMVFPKGILFP